MTDSKLPITGGCLCGAVRYESTEPPTDGGYCHCTMCQKESGGFHTVMIAVPESGFRVTKGKPKFFASSETGRRGFCQECGSPLIGLFVGIPSAVINVGSLDHPEHWPVNQEGWFGHFYVDSKIPWEIIGDDLPQENGYDPTRFQE